MNGGAGGSTASTLAAPNASLTIGSLLDPRCVAARLVAQSAADAIEQAAALLVAIGAATEEYGSAAVAREIEYPTGLPTEPVGVALPHADEGVLRPAISLLTLRDPVAFGEMGTGEPNVSVGVVVLLALPAGDAHVLAIGALAEMIQQRGFLAQAARAATADALYTTFQAWASGSAKED